MEGSCGETNSFTNGATATWVDGPELAAVGIVGGVLVAGCRAATHTASMAGGLDVASWARMQACRWRASLYHQTALRAT